MNLQELRYLVAVAEHRHFGHAAEACNVSQPTLSSQIRKLERGGTHALPKFVDSRVPVYCGGVLKAWGKPVVSRGVLAVQIISVVHGQGNQS